MKAINQFLKLIVAMLLLANTSVFAQDEAMPQYYTMTTMHWNMDNDDFKMSDWKAVEKEFLDKVISKNEHILGASFYLHNMTPDNTELLYVQVFASWDDIDKATKRNSELIKEGWADEEARKAFFKKRNNFYSPMHSDEIYAVMPHTKPLAETPTKDMICYVRKGHFNFDDGGSNDEFTALNKEYAENVTHKNEYIKGYYPFAHAWGADRTEFNEAFFLESLADLEKMFKKDDELFEAHWKDEASRKMMSEKSKKYFKGTHGDYVYTFVAGLSK